MIIPEAQFEWILPAHATKTALRAQVRAELRVHVKELTDRLDALNAAIHTTTAMMTKCLAAPPIGMPAGSGLAIALLIRLGG